MTKELTVRYRMGVPPVPPLPVEMSVITASPLLAKTTKMLLEPPLAQGRSLGVKLEKMTIPDRPNAWVITFSLAASVTNQPGCLSFSGWSTKSVPAPACAPAGVIWW